MKRQFCAACGATENLSQNDRYFDWRDVGDDNWCTTAFAEERKITLCEECAANARDYKAMCDHHAAKVFGYAAKVAVASPNHIASRRRADKAEVA